MDVQEHWKDVIDSIDKYDKFFVKEIYDNNDAYRNGCYVGLIRPYVAAHPKGGNYQVYICTSHVLNCRNYDLKYSLGNVGDIPNIWQKANIRCKNGKSPYEIDEESPGRWNDKCKHCYYYNNNKLLHTVASKLPDRNFP